MSTRGRGLHGDTLPTDFHDFVVCLNRERADYLLVGAYALGFHGVVRATGDLDILFRPSQPNVRRLLRALASFGAPPEVLDEQALLRPEIVTQFGSPPFRIDLLSAISGVTLDEVWKGAIDALVGNEPVRVIGLKELRANKASTGRTKDRDDLRRLDALAKRKRRP